MTHRVSLWACGFILAFGLLSYCHAAEYKLVTLQVNGMTTPTCPVLLKSAVSKIKGVKRVEASIEHHSATIEYDDNLTDLVQIQDTIEFQAGFTTDIK